MSVSKTLNKAGTRLTATFYIKKEAARGAREIYLICEHNGWEQVAMKPQHNGTFRGSITVPANGQESYQYRFKYIMENGEERYENDWAAEAYCANPFSGENSVFTVNVKKQ